MTETYVANGNTYTDDGDPDTGLGNGGHLVRLLPMLSDTMVELAARSAVVGGGAFSMRYTVDLVSQADADPGAGKLRFNHATPASATSLFADLVDADGSTVTAILDALDDSTSTAKGVLTVRSLTDAAVWLQFTLTAVTTAVGYRKLVGTYLAGPGGFTAAESVLLAFAPKGDKGDTGSAADIHGQTELTAPATADELLIADASAAYAALRITLANLLKVVALLTAKTTPLGADGLLLIDSAASNAAKLVTRAQLLAGRHTIGLLAGSCFPATTNGCAGAAQAETSSNKINYKYLAFDPSATERAFSALPTPKGAAVTSVSFRIVWTHPATSTNFGVAWQIEILSLADDDALDTALGTGVIVTDTGGTTGDFYTTAESAAVTPGNSWAKQDWFFIRVSRIHDNAGDTMAVDAHLIGVEIYYNTDAADDS